MLVNSLGHRNQQGLALQPETGMPWATEHAPQGGDELNAILPGRNYGWPVVSYGRHYDGPRIARRFWQEGPHWLAFTRKPSPRKIDATMT